MIATPKLNDDFFKILDKVIVRAYKNKSPIANNNKDIVIGELVIVNNDRVYSIVSRKTNKLLYSELFLIDAAFLIAKHHQLRHGQFVKQVLELEDRYAKNYLDMKSYTNSYHHAMLIEDNDVADIMQTRYEQAKHRAKKLKTEIQLLRERITKKR